MIENIPPIIVINLDRSIDRRKSIESQMKKHSLDFEFFKAVDKNALSESQMAAYDREEALKDFGSELTTGEIACALSHIGVWDKMVRENIPKAIIFEDDIVINDDTVEIFKLQQLIPRAAELIYYYHGKVKSLPWKRKTIYKNYKLVKYLSPSKKSKRTIIYAAAYQLTKSGAEKLLKSAYPADYYLGYIQRNRLIAYGIEPCCLELGNFATTIPDRYD